MIYGETRGFGMKITVVSLERLIVTISLYSMLFMIFKMAV